MATLKSFRAWRPKPEFVSQIASVPYDVIHSSEARKIAESNPHSFVKVIRPEVSLNEGIDLYSEEVYKIGLANLEDLLNSNQFLQELDPAIYLYQMRWDGNTKTGIFGCVSVDDYDQNLILKHELTRPDKEDDRTKHIITQKAHAEPVMMTFQSNSTIQHLMENVIRTSPLYQFTADDSVEHLIWKVDNPESFSSEFSKIPTIYIADGHHRCASASRAAKEVDLKKHPEAKIFPAVLYPLEEVNILAYNRFIYKISDDFWPSFTSAFNVSETENPKPEKHGVVCFYYQSKWYKLQLPETAKIEQAARLDVARVQEFILEPYLGITDQRLDKNISFIGGSDSIKKLAEIVDSGEADLAISFYPTSMEELVAVSDAGELMPPKSTWFEPKLKSGILIHTF